MIRDRVVSWLEAAGCTVRVDRMGNIFGRRPAAPGGEGRPPVVMGSHVDSVPTGGRFDGALGVVCAIEAVRALDDAAGRDPPPGRGGGLHERGGRPLPAGDARLGGDGRQDLAGGRLPGPRPSRHPARGRARADRLPGPEPCAARPMRAYLELHIEQGPLLEEAGCPSASSRASWRSPGRG